MPILIRNFDFEQSSTHVYITVPWPIFTSTKATDVFANEVYIKINQPPFFFELDLAHPIDDDQSSVKILDKSIVFTLVKKETDLEWINAAFNPLSKEELKARREEADRVYLLKKQLEKEKQSKEKWEKQRYLVKQQMEVEQKEREKLQQVKDQEKFKAEASIQEWTESLAVAASIEHQNEESSDDDDDEIIQLKGKYQAILDKKKEGLSIKAFNRPPPRSAGSLSITFTPRLFPTAARESQDAKWMAQLEEAKHTSQQDIQKLESKSNQFVKSEQWYLAIETLTEALRLAPQNHRFHVSRSECYFKIGHYDAALKDIQQALQHIEAMESKLELVNVYDHIKQVLNKRKEECLEKLSHSN